MAQFDILDPFTRIHPGQFIGKFSDWILFSLLLFFFWAVAGIALRNRFQNSRHLRVLITSISLMLAIGTYFSIYRGWLHLSLAGLGMFGAVLIFIIIFFIIFGLMRGYGINLWTALPLGYALFYVSLWVVSPNILNNLSDISPQLNGILLILFFASIFKIIAGFFRYSRDPTKAAKSLQTTHFTSPDDVEIEKEIKEDKQEKKLLKAKTIKLTKVEIKTLDDIAKHLNQMTTLIKERGQNIDQNEIAQLTKTLREIARNENILKRGMDLIKRHIMAYKSLHRKDIGELEKRLSQEKDLKKRKTIEEELTYQKRMIEALKFMEVYESRISEFTNTFNRLLYTAMQKLKTIQPNDAIIYIEKATDGIHQIRSIYEKQREIEKYLLTLNKKTIRDLKKEKARI